MIIEMKNHLLKFINNNVFDIFVFIIIISYCVLMSELSLFRLNTFHLEYDLAVFIQDFWTTIYHGDLFYNSLHPNSQFGIHFSPVLSIFLPFFAFYPGPDILLVMQTIFLGFGAYPVYYFGKHCIDKKTGIIQSFLYLLYPALHGVNLYDFHELCVAPLIIGLTLMAMLMKKPKFFIIFACLSLLIREDVTLIVIMTGIIGYYLNRDDSQKVKRIYLTITGIALLWFILTMVFFIPGSSLDSAKTHNGFINQYLNPDNDLLSQIEFKGLYIWQILSPISLLSLLSPEILLISLPSWIEILGSPNLAYFSIYYQYSALLIPIIFFSTAVSLQKIKKSIYFTPPRYSHLLHFIFLIAVLSFFLISPAMDQMKLMHNGLPEIPYDHRDALEKAIQIIPEDASLTTQYNVLPFAAQRKNLTVGYVSTTDYILIDNTLFWRIGDFLEKELEIKENFSEIYYDQGISIWKKHDKKSQI